jgi:hypothetical protein
VVGELAESRRKVVGVGFLRGLFRTVAWEHFNSPLQVFRWRRRVLQIDEEFIVIVVVSKSRRIDVETLPVSIALVQPEYVSAVNYSTGVEV